MRCPKCGLENPPGGSWCDCGYDFSTGEVVPARNQNRRRSFRDLRWLLAAITCAGVVAALVEQLWEVHRMLPPRMTLWDALGQACSYWDEQAVGFGLVAAGIIFVLIILLLYDLRLEVRLTLAIFSSFVAFATLKVFDYSWTLVISRIKIL